MQSLVSSNHGQFHQTTLRSSDVVAEPTAEKTLMKRGLSKRANEPEKGRFLSLNLKTYPSKKCSKDRVVNQQTVHRQSAGNRG